MIKIIYTSGGLGNRFDDHIEINKNLKNYPELYKEVLAHELQHTNEAFTFKDLALDLGESNINRWDLFKFMLKHPKSFSQLLPIYWSKKHGFVYDINLILIYSVIGLLLIVTIYLAV